MTDDIIDALIASTRLPTKAVDICGRGDLVDMHRALVAELNDVTDGGTSVAGVEVGEVSARIVQCEQDMTEAVVRIVLQAVGREEWTKLLAAHPPTLEQRAAGETCDPITFPPAAVAACAIEPRITASQATAMSRTLHAGEWAKLWDAVIGLNVAPMPRPKLAAASELARPNAQSATTPAPAESLAQRSSAGGGAASPSTSTPTTDG